MYADDYSTWRELAITPVADSPRHIAAAALNTWSWDHVIVWDDKEGVHAVRGEIAKAMKCVTVAPKGSLPTVASDGRQFMVAWLDGTNVLAADPEHPDEVQVIATDAATFMPFLRLIWSPSTDFVVYWRRGTDPAKLELMRQQLVLADEAVKPAAH
jgi:hypothetical protein